MKRYTDDVTRKIFGASKRNVLFSTFGPVAALILLSGAPAQAQNAESRVTEVVARDIPLVLSADTFLDEEPGNGATLPGTDISLSDRGALNPGLVDLVRENPDRSVGAILQQAAALQQILTGATAAISGQIAGLALDIADGGAGGSFVNAPFASGAQGRELSMFAVSGATKISHGGFQSSSALLGGNGRTPDFEEVDYGFTIGLRWDASNYFDLARNTVTFGLLANYTHSDIDIGPNDVLGQFFDKTGSADIDSWTAGAFGLVTDGVKYGLVTVAATLGAPTAQNAVLNSTADYDTLGVAASAMGGVLLPVSGGAKLDMRGGFNFVSASAEDYNDSAGVSYSNSQFEEISGTVSARLFHVTKLQSATLRPFIQGGLNHRLHYRNEVDVEGVAFSFDDADTTYFARAGLDFDLDRYMQAYVAVRGDKSESLEALSAQLGLTFKLD